MTKTGGIAAIAAKLFCAAALVLGTTALALAQTGVDSDSDRWQDHRAQGTEKVLYIWAQDEAHVAPDFLAVIDFDEQSPKYGQVINVVPLHPRQYRQRTAPLPPEFEQDHPGMRRTAQPAEKSEWNFLL